MAEATSSPKKSPNSNLQIDNPISQPDPSQPPPSLSTPSRSNPVLPPPPLASPSQPPSFLPYADIPSSPSFRPAAPPVPLPMPPQYSPIPNANYQPQNHGVQPPGVGPGSAGLIYAQPPNPTMRPYMQMPNGYMPMPPPVSS